MGDTSKILDVSYGTFSCRLEGFDDSVETMKTVVSFFHTLAGHDRFMDVAPQAPDMATLAALTAAQAGAPVDIESENGGSRVSLRLKRPEIAADTADQDSAAPSLRIKKPDTAQDASGVARDGALAANEEDFAATDLDDEIAEAAHAEDTAVFEDEDDDDLDDAADNLMADDFEEDDDEDAAPEDTAAEDTVAEAPFYDPAEQDDARDSNDSIAAKLQRIRAVVGRTATPAVEDSFSEDLTDSPETTTAPLANPLAQRLAALAQRNAARIIQEEQSGDDAEDTIAQTDEDSFDDDDDLTTAQPDDDAAEMATDDAQTDGDIAFDDATEDDAMAPATSDDTEEFSLHDEVAEVAREIALRRENNRSKRDELPDNDDEEMSRILSQADERLNEPEGRRHRDAFAQLKAAVAATEAARQLGDPGADVRDPGEAFRDDLDVHDTTDALDTDDDAPTAAPSPLRLVPAQRVDDTDQTPDRATERLRQIASTKEDIGAGDSDFAEFAKQQGATELADLLEAAAAYIAFVEGDDDFSRPQVMKKVQMASTDEFSREDGLRSFGRLLRQSKIIKLNNGRFQVSEDTRFRPDDKAAQG